MDNITLEIEELIDCMHVEDLHEQKLDQLTGTLESYSAILGKLDSEELEKIAPVFEGIEGFTDAFGSDPEMWAENIDASAAMEGMKAQDFFRWGLAGLLLGMWFASFKRLLKVIPKRISQFEDKDRSFVKFHNQYLPDYDDAVEILDGMHSIQKFIEKATVSPKNASMADFDKELSRLGVDPELKDDESRYNETDWSFVVKSWTGAIGLALLGAPLGQVFAFFFHDKVAPLNDRGWTDKNLLEFTKDYYQLLRGYERFVDSIGKLDKGANVDGLPSDKKQELRSIRRMLRNTCKAYKFLLKRMGRGVASTKLGSM